MHLESTSLVLRYNPGMFTFNRFDATASDAALFELAQDINAFQADNAQVTKVQTFSVW
jgi:hypothetical protein